MNWISVKFSLPEKEMLCEVKKSYGGILSPVRLKTTADDCSFNRYREDWVYKSGLHAGMVEIEDIWMELKK